MANTVSTRTFDFNTVIQDPSLSLFQKVLLATDGTVTQLLEIYTGQSVKVEKLAQIIVHNEACDRLQTQASHALLKRSILLCNHQQTLLYAQSYFVIDRLPDSMNQALLNSDQPIGLLWRAERMETYREITHFSRQADPALAHYFNVADDEPFLARTYLIFRQHQPLGMITEKFPVSYFRS